MGAWMHSHAGVLTCIGASSLCRRRSWDMTCFQPISPKPPPPPSPPPPPPAALLAAMRGVDDDLFYEASDDAIDAWCSSRASRLSRLFAALRDRAGGGGVTLAWLRDLAPWAALRQLRRLVGGHRAAPTSDDVAKLHKTFFVKFRY